MNGTIRMKKHNFFTLFAFLFMTSCISGDFKIEISSQQVIVHYLMAIPRIVYDIKVVGKNDAPAGYLVNVPRNDEETRSALPEGSSMDLSESFAGDSVMIEGDFIFPNAQSFLSFSENYCHIAKYENGYLVSFEDQAWALSSNEDIETLSVFKDDFEILLEIIENGNTKNYTYRSRDILSSKSLTAEVQWTIP